MPNVLDYLLNPDPGIQAVRQHLQEEIAATGFNAEEFLPTWDLPVGTLLWHPVHFGRRVQGWRLQIVDGKANNGMLSGRLYSFKQQKWSANPYYIPPASLRRRVDQTDQRVRLALLTLR